MSGTLLVMTPASHSVTQIITPCCSTSSEPTSTTGQFRQWQGELFLKKCFYFTKLFFLLRYKLYQLLISLLFGLDLRQWLDSLAISPVVISFYLLSQIFSVLMGGNSVGIQIFGLFWNNLESVKLSSPFSPPLYPSLCLPWSVTQASVVLLQFWSVGAREKYFENISNLKIFHIQRHLYSFPPGGASRYPTFFWF